MKEVIHEMYSKEQIDQMVTEIATRINKDYEGKQIHMICICVAVSFLRRSC